MRKLTQEEFIERSKIIHVNKNGHPKNGYSKVIYNGYKSNIIVLCLEHDEEFSQSAYGHLIGREGCKKCLHEIMLNVNKLTLEEFIIRAIIVHGDKYDYKYVIYKGVRYKIKILCNRCKKIFMQNANDHLSGYGCGDCERKIGNKKRLCKQEDIIFRFNLVHGNRYGYEKVIFLGVHIKVEIYCYICKKYFWQEPRSHLSGSGCPCNRAGGISEKKLFLKLKNEFIDTEVISQGKPIWLKTKGDYTQSYDIYFPIYNIAIEYQGRQHYKPIHKWGGVNKFNYMQELDKIKRMSSKINNCELFYFTYGKSEIPPNYPHKVYTNEEELIIDIQNLINNKK